MRAWAIVAGMTLAASTAAGQTSTGHDAPAVGQSPERDHGYSYAPEVSAPPEVEIERDRNGGVFVFRAGALRGTGSSRVECVEEPCAGSEERASYDEAETLFFGSELLWHVSSSFRLGLALGFVPSMAVDGPDGDFEMGPQFSLGLPFEGVFDLSDHVALTLRGQVDLTTLVPAGDLADVADAARDACNESSDLVCDVDMGPYFGAAAGIGGGVLIGAGGVAFRADLLVQAYTIKTISVEYGDGSVEALNFGGTRALLTAGIEL